MSRSKRCLACTVATVDIGRASKVEYANPTGLETLLSPYETVQRAVLSCRLGTLSCLFLKEAAAQKTDRLDKKEMEIGAAEYFEVVAFIRMRVIVSTYDSRFVTRQLDLTWLPILGQKNGQAAMPIEAAGCSISGWARADADQGETCHCENTVARRPVQDVDRLECQPRE